MKLVLAEKPSVAQSIAKVLGAAKREDGYLEGNGYVVSWCVGHLVELAQPEVYDAKYSKWAYKGKTVAQCLADRTDYSQNAAKTNDGEFISSYECDPKTADEEFLLSKRQYQHITGRQQKNNIIAYQIRQSFKPGEITPEEANQVGYETAMRWTKGKHAFIVATHIDKSHIRREQAKERFIAT